MFQFMFFILIIVHKITVEGQLVQQGKLQFKLSARDLPDTDTIGLTDPYVELYYTDQQSNNETKITQSEAITDTINPDWVTQFDFDYDRSKGQRWHFKIYDKDHGREDDLVGSAWVIVDDFVDRGQKYTVNLHKQGTLSLETIEPTKAKAVVFQPMIQKEKLRFTIIGRNLPDKDNLGSTDPYVEIFYTEKGNDKQTRVGRTDTLKNIANPNWSNIFEFEYDRSKRQRFYFKVYDHDRARDDDTVGRGWVILDDYVDRGQVYTMNLHKKGTLTLTSARPVVKPNAVL